MRGVALVLALANYLKSEFAARGFEGGGADEGIAEYSMWSKDIIFLISDGYIEGTQAWLDSYHGFGQTSASFSLPPRAHR